MSMIDEYSKPDADGYVLLGFIGLSGQTQYNSRFAHGTLGKPNLGEGLRFKGDSGNYHEMRVHQDDAAEFKRRVEAYYAERL